jgi:hypothetical protein
MTPTANGLWRLQGELFEMMEAREEVARMCDPLGGNYLGELHATESRTQLTAIETGIQAYVRDKLVQVDDLREPLMALSEGVALCKARAAAETNRAIMLQNRFDRLKDAIKQAMQFLEQAGYWKPKQSKKLESAHGSFLLKGNGGSQPVEITDEALVPDEYCKVTVRISYPMWKEICVEMSDALIGTTSVGPREVSKSAIAEALAKLCATCHGLPLGKQSSIHPSMGNPEITCSACGGSGLQGVPGARLAPRGESVVVK